MKTKIKKIDYDQLESFPKREDFKVRKQSFFIKLILNLFMGGSLRKNHFKCDYYNMENLGKNEPCLILMNHSSFIDLVMINKIFNKRRFATISTDDGFISTYSLLKMFGCIPTSKFIPDLNVPLRMKEVVDRYNESILLFPEATYSFDGRNSTLDPHLGKLVKYLSLPLVIVISNGNYLYDPLYNNLQKRKIDLSAKVSYALSPQEISKKSENEIEKIIKGYFQFDAFKFQTENHIKISEPFRADCLERVLYKCPHCGNENSMLGKGTKIVCKNCHNEYELNPYGELVHTNGKGKFSSIPEWYDYEKDEVIKEIKSGNYLTKCKVNILVNRNFKTLYDIGSGTLVHNKEGFFLYLYRGEDKLIFSQTNKVYYSLYTDFYWYELGDLICIGDKNNRYCCIIKDGQQLAAKTRIAAEYFYGQETK